jgi:hypothetical protein
MVVLKWFRWWYFNCVKFVVMENGPNLTHIGRQKIWQASDGCCMLYRMLPILLLLICRSSRNLYENRMIFYQSIGKMRPQYTCMYTCTSGPIRYSSFTSIRDACLSQNICWASQLHAQYLPVNRWWRNDSTVLQEDANITTRHFTIGLWFFW